VLLILKIKYYKRFVFLISGAQKNYVIFGFTVNLTKTLIPKIR